MTGSLRDEIGPERFDELAAQGVRDAIAELHAAGLPSIGTDETGRVCKVYADGTKVYVDDEPE
ncbi:MULTISPECIES: hypothetical protein [unclassified Embleya]|uniref:hypothetical protein n=1 Tax=unclassified Embleya TaxID=2699296 RepID=UPI0033CB0D6E